MEAEVEGVVIISLPPPEDPSQGKTITAFTYSTSPPPSPSRTLFTLFALALLAAFLFSEAPVLLQLLESGASPNEHSETESFLLPLYPKGEGNRTSLLELGGLKLVTSAKSSSSSSSSSSSVVFPIRGNVYPDGQNPRKGPEDEGIRRKRPTASMRREREVPLTLVEPEALPRVRQRYVKKTVSRPKRPAPSTSTSSSSSDEDISNVQNRPIDGSGPSQQADNPVETPPPPTDAAGPSQQPESPVETRPNGCSMLPSIENHIAYEIWNNPESSRLLTVINHGKKCNSWGFEFFREAVKDKIRATDFQNLANYTYKMVDNALISAFVERWHPETNTFHLPAGEMTITLDDVHHILGLRVDGRSMMTPRYVEKDIEYYGRIVDDVSNLLGVEASSFTSLEAFKKAYGLPLYYLEETFDDPEPVDEHVDMLARGFMMFILGAVGIPDKSGTAINAKYIMNFVDMDTLGEISFGSGILAYLYRELGKASRVGSKTISGCQTLLHAWIYEHFPTLKRAKLNRHYDEDLPRMCRWQPSKEEAKRPHTLAALRNALEDMRAEEIIWNPYRNLRQSSRPLQPISLFYGVISCHSIVEPYLPDRVLRQFGYIQTVPTRTLNLISAPGGTKAQNYIPAVYHWVSYFFDEWQSHVIGEAERVAAVNITDCSDDYVAYYKGVGMPTLFKRGGDIIRVPEDLPAKSVLYTALVKMARKAKKLGRSLVSCQGKNFMEISEELQCIDNSEDFPFMGSREQRSKRRHDV